MKLENKRVVITGGTSGIGYRLVEHLHRDNHLIVISKNPDRLRDLSREFSGVITYPADLSRAEDIEEVSDAIVKRFEFIDVLINNAAVQNAQTFLDEKFRHESIAREITINLTCICSMTYLLLPALLHQNSAVILNVNSALALAPKTSAAIYCATKGALNIFSQSLRYQLENTNISVQQVFLELVDTPMTAGRGRNKMDAGEAARRIIDGITRDVQDHDMRKVKMLRLLLRLAPSVARKIMKRY